MQSSTVFGAGGLSVYSDFDPAWMNLLSKPLPSDDKYSRGVVGFVTGSTRYPGAALLGVTAASRAGVGLIRLASDSDVTDLALQMRPEIVLASADTDASSVPRVAAWVLGSGVAEDSLLQRKRIHTVLDSLTVTGLDPMLVLDAAAVSREFLGKAERSVLTPHAGEAARLFGEFGVQIDRTQIEAEPLTHAQELATLTGATMILKGNRTVCASPERGALWQSPPAPASLASAGTGDVLAGLLGALLAKSKQNVFAITCLAVWLHAQAAHELDRAGHWAALDLAQQLAITVSNAEDGKYVA